MNPWRHFRKRRRRHDIRLHRQLFWYLGFTILCTIGIVFGVVHLVSPELHSMREQSARLESFAGSRFERVWLEPKARAELVRAVAEAFDASVHLKASDGTLLESVGEPCGSSGIVIDVRNQNAVLGNVTACVNRRRGPGWAAGLAALFAAFVTIWAAAAKLTHRLTRPLRDLTRVTKEIGAGRLESRVRLGHTHRGEVGILAEAINDMAVRIERQIKDQRELLAGVSHEIRSPLARLRVLAELLQDGRYSPETAAKIEREVVEIDDLIGKLLASSRLDFGALDHKPLSARELCLRALERAGLPAELLDDQAPEASLSGDATLLSRALGNLLENAGHHAGGVVRVRLRASGQDVCFDVEDAGPGLGPEAIARGFDPFFRGREGAGITHGSLGLGLSLVRRIARAHGGEASIANLAGQGAIATLSLPKLGEPGRRDGLASTADV